MVQQRQYRLGIVGASSLMGKEVSDELGDSRPCGLRMWFCWEMKSLPAEWRRPRMRSPSFSG